jgi:hypothetical protein
MLRDGRFGRGRGDVTAGKCSVRREVSRFRDGGVVVLRIKQSLDVVESFIGFGVLG